MKMIEHHIQNIIVSNYNNFKTDGKNFFDQPIKNDATTYKNRKIVLVKEMITQLVVCWIILTLKKIIK